MNRNTLQLLTAASVLVGLAAVAAVVRAVQFTNVEGVRIDEYEPDHYYFEMDLVGPPGTYVPAWITWSVFGDWYEWVDTFPHIPFDEQGRAHVHASGGWDPVPGPPLPRPLIDGDTDSIEIQGRREAGDYEDDISYGIWHLAADGLLHRYPLATPVAPSTWGKIKARFQP